jgi:RNA polymerase sigma-70 factor (ECF subfamily)
MSSDVELVRRARSGEDLAWESIVEAHRESVFRLAYLLVGDPAEAEDVAQETLIRAMRNLRRFDEGRPLRPWLLRITSNLARNRRRSIRRYWRALQRAARMEPEPRDRDPSTKDDSRLLWQAIRSLRYDDQQILYLRYFLAMSEQETASALELPQGTVKSRLHRALKRLRQVVARDFPELRSA